MKQAANDPDFIARCNEIQRDFAHIDYPEKTGHTDCYPFLFVQTTQ